VGSIVIRRLDDDRRPCRPFVEYCTWTGRAGTKLVLETTADPPLNHHEWFLDCTGTGNCTMIMDSNKFIQLTWTAP
jgi:hypothetical protein